MGAVATGRRVVGTAMRRAALGDAMVRRAALVETVPSRATGLVLLVLRALQTRPLTLLVPPHTSHATL